MTATGVEPTTTQFVNEHSAIQPNWLNGWVFVYELSGSGFESSSSQQNSSHRIYYCEKFTESKLDVKYVNTVKSTT